MRDEGAVAFEVLHKQQHLLQHLSLGERVERAAFGIGQERCSGEEREAAGAHHDGVRLVEDLGGVQRVLAAVAAPGNAVQERVPIGDARFIKLRALLDDVCGVVALVDAIQRPVITARRCSPNPAVLFSEPLDPSHNPSDAAAPI